MNKRNLIYYALQTIIVACMTCMMSLTVIDNFSSLTNFQLSIERKDYVMSDVYNTVANKRPVQTLSSDIVVIGVDGLSRDGISDIIDTINQYSPSVIGMDIMFTWPYDGDEKLINSLRKCNNLIMPVQLNGYESEGHYSELISCYFSDSLRANYGATNLESFTIRQSVREFRSTYYCDDTPIKGFAAAVASCYMPEVNSRLLQRKKSSDYIAYASRLIDAYNADELLSTDYDLEVIFNNKIVLIGDLEDVHDYHVTPINEGMPGIMIHAHAIDTILSGSYIEKTSNFLDWLIAVILSTIFIGINFYTLSKNPNLGNFLIRVVQVALLYIMFIIGCRLFSTWGVFIDFAPTFAMLSLSLFMYDIWIGLVGIAEHLYMKQKSKTDQK